MTDADIDERLEVIERMGGICVAMLLDLQTKLGIPPSLADFARWRKMADELCGTSTGAESDGEGQA